MSFVTSIPLAMRSGLPESGVQLPPILNLPEEVFHSILYLLRIQDIGRITLTCKDLSKKSIKIIEQAITLFPNHPSPTKNIILKPLLPSLKGYLFFMYQNMPMKEVLQSYILCEQSKHIFKALSNHDETLLRNAFALFLDHGSRSLWKRLNPDNCNHIVHLELNANWLQKGVMDDVLNIIRTCFPNLTSFSFQIEKKLNFNLTPLHLLSRYGLTQLVKLVIASGADVNQKDENGDTPLHYSTRPAWPIEKVFKETTIELIRAGADVNARNKNGYTPLHAALRSKDKATALELIRAGADIHAQNEDGETPLEIAEQQGFSATMMATIAAGDLPGEHHDHTPIR